MSATPGWCLRLKAQPDFRVDFGGVLPARLAGMTADEVARVEVRHGNAMLALGELFDIAALLLSVVAFVWSIHWSHANADAQYGRMWPQVLATALGYGVWLGVMTLAFFVRRGWLRSRAQG